MTVCIAAIYEDHAVVGASDRLLTAGDVQFQPDTSKVKALTNSIVAMTAGDASLQAEILDLVKRDISFAIMGAPDVWLDVGLVATWYCNHWAEVKRRRAERHILAPLGLKTETFLASQATMNDKSVQDISNALISFGMPPTATLIVGVDSTGPHIFVTHDGSLTQADAVGFAAIGTGARHAESQLMLAKYAPSSSAPAALALIHLAKARAEVAPGVGCDTDVFVIGPQLGTYLSAPQGVVDHLQGQVEKMRQNEAAALIEAEAGVRAFFESLDQEEGPQEADPDDPSGNGE